MTRVLLPLAALSLAALVGCQQRAATVQVSPPSLAAVYGGSPQTFTASVSGGSGTILWTLTPASGAGSLSASSGPSVVYTPPATFGPPISATLTATLQGSASSASASITVSGGIISDRALKTDFAPLNTAALLEGVARLPLASWRYRGEAPGVRHLGPMAQDFHAAFGLNGPDDQHIAVVDEGGVALAAIQALYRQNQQLRQQNAQLARQLGDVERRLQALEQR